MEFEHKINNYQSLVKSYQEYFETLENGWKYDCLVVLGPSRSSALLGFGSSFWEKKLGSARLAMPSKKLGSARHILQKSSVQLGLLYDLKNPTLKTKKMSWFPTFLQIS